MTNATAVNSYLSPKMKFKFLKLFYLIEILHFKICNQIVLFFCYFYPIDDIQQRNSEFGLFHTWVYISINIHEKYYNCRRQKHLFLETIQ